MWQSQIEIKHYSISYFDCITVFEVLYRRSSVKGEAHTHYVNVVSIHELNQCI